MLVSMRRLPIYQYRDLSIISFQKSVKKRQFSIIFFLHSKLNDLMKIVDKMEKFS